jgi:hypothetical protein
VKDPAGHGTICDRCNHQRKKWEEDRKREAAEEAATAKAEARAAKAEAAAAADAKFNVGNPWGGTPGFGSLGKKCAVEVCGATSTPNWMRGPLGPKTLCTSCYKKYQSWPEQHKAAAAKAAEAAAVAAARQEREDAEEAARAYGESGEGLEIAREKINDALQGISARCMGADDTGVIYYTPPAASGPPPLRAHLADPSVLFVHARAPGMASGVATTQTISGCRYEMRNPGDRRFTCGDVLGVLEQVAGGVGVGGGAGAGGGGIGGESGGSGEPLACGHRFSRVALVPLGALAGFCAKTNYITIDGVAQACPFLVHDLDANNPASFAAAAALLEVLLVPSSVSLGLAGLMRMNAEYDSRLATLFKLVHAGARVWGGVVARDPQWGRLVAAQAADREAAKEAVARFEALRTPGLACGEHALLTCRSAIVARLRRRRLVLV